MQQYVSNMHRTDKLLWKHWNTTWKNKKSKQPKVNLILLRFSYVKCEHCTINNVLNNISQSTASAYHCKQNFHHLQLCRNTKCMQKCLLIHVMLSHSHLLMLHTSGKKHTLKYYLVIPTQKWPIKMRLGLFTLGSV